MYNECQNAGQYDGPAAAGVLIQKSCQGAAVTFMQLEAKDRVALVQQAFGIALNDHRQEQHHRQNLYRT